MRRRVAAVGHGRGLVHAVIAPRRPGREADAADQRGRRAERPRQQRRTQAARRQVSASRPAARAHDATVRNGPAPSLEVDQRPFGEHVVARTDRDLLHRDARRRNRTRAPPPPRPAYPRGTGWASPRCATSRDRCGCAPGSRRGRSAPRPARSVSDDATSCTSALRAVRRSTIRSRQWTQGSPVTGERTTSGPGSALAWNFTSFGIG